MTAVAISPKFQIVIPKKVRESMQLRAGMKVEVIPYNNRIKLIPLQPMKKMRGILKGINTNIKREKDRL